MQESFHNIVKVFYFVPLVCYKSAVAVFPETYCGGNYRMVRVGLAVSTDMKSKTVGIKTLLDTVTNIHDGFAAKGDPIVFSQVYQVVSLSSCP